MSRDAPPGPNHRLQLSCRGGGDGGGERGMKGVLAGKKVLLEGKSGKRESKWAVSKKGYCTEGWSDSL